MRNVQPGLTTPRFTVMLQLRFEKSLCAAKEAFHAEMDPVFAGKVSLDWPLRIHLTAATRDGHLKNLTNAFPINGMPGLHSVGRQIYGGFPSDPVGSSNLRLSKEGATWRTPKWVYINRGLSLTFFASPDLTGIFN